MTTVVCWRRTWCSLVLAWWLSRLILCIPAAWGQESGPLPATQEPVTGGIQSPLDQQWMTDRVITLQYITSADLMDELQALYPRGLWRESARNAPGPVHYQLDVHGPPRTQGGRSGLELMVGRRPREVQLRGTSAMVDEATKLVLALELHRTARGARVLRQQPDRPLRDDLPRGAGRGPAPREMELGEPSANEPSRGAWPAEESDGVSTGTEWIRRTQFSEAVPAPSAATPDAGPDAGQNTGEQDGPVEGQRLDPQLRRRLRDLGEDVQIEVLPDLDAIILRGRDQDIDELAKIIEQIERLAADAQPRIEIYPLQHSQDAAIADLIEDVEDEYTGGRQGRVSVTALGKPNSLLIIGWGSAVDATLELIQKLDQPVAPETQFDVIFLRHAAAAEAAATLDEFFADREGLGARFVVTPDRRTNAVVIHAAPRDLQEARRLLEQLDRRHGQSRAQARVVTLEHSLATDIGEVLDELLQALRGGDADQRTAALELLTLDAEGRRRLLAVPLERVSVTPNPYNNTLVLSGSSDSLDALAELIRMLDTPRDASQIKVFPIQYGDAANLVEVLQSLLLADGDGGTQLPNATGETSLAPLRFSVDERTNTIIATGPEGDLQIVAALLTRLDESDASQRKNAVYHLKNAPALEVATAINQFLSSKRQIEDAAASAANVFQRLEKEVVVVPEPINNKLILSATPRFFDELNDLIQRLDEAPPQVVIQVLIGEVVLNNTDEFGVELGLQDSVLFDRSLLGDLVTTVNTSQTSTPSGIVTITEEIIQAATNQPGFNFNNGPLGNSASDRALQNSNTVGAQGLSSFAVGRINDELGFGGLVLSASSESVSLLIRALQETRRLEVLSRPQVRTLDNQPAFVQIGQRVPRITSSSITQFGQTNAIDFDDVGLILGVTPRISPDGTVVMEIDAEKSSLATQEGVPISTSADGSVIRAPIVNTTRAQTTVSAANGETIVLAGLITKEMTTVHRSVPHLSKIPVLGNIFRYDGTQMRRTELLIILTPHVIYAPEDSERLKQIEMARMSWCAADVIDIHGDVNYRFVEDAHVFDADAPVVYPHENPTGAETGAAEIELPLGESPSPFNAPETLPLPLAD